MRSTRFVGASLLGTGRLWRGMEILRPWILNGSSASTSSAAASPVSRSASPGKDSPSVTPDGSGPSLRGSFAHYDHATSSWRTSQVCLDGDLETWSATWPRAGTTRSGIAFQRQPLVPLTVETESGLWPTPVAQDDNKSPEAHMAMKARMPGGSRYTITSLTVMVKAVNRRLWPTPNVQGAPGAGSRDRGGRQASLPASLKDREGSGALNPTWVEWLTGFPLGWTDCGDSVTRSSRKSPSISADDCWTDDDLSW